MIENILYSNTLGLIIILRNPYASLYFLHKYVSKTDWIKVFKNLNQHKDILPFMKKYFKMEYFKDEYLFSAVNGHLEVVKLLVEKGADIHVKNGYALRLASENGHTEIVDLLLHKGADVHARNDEALILASENAHLEVVELLLKKGAKNYKALISASMRGQLEVVRILLEKGADANVLNTALIFANDYGHTKVAELLETYSKIKYLKLINKIFNISFRK